MRSAGFEPATFSSGARRAVHCATSAYVEHVNDGCLPDGVALARLAGNRWSRMRDSNPRQPVYKTGALPAELTRRSWSGRRDSNPRIMAWEAIAVPLGYARITRDIIPADFPLVKPVTPRLCDCFLLALRSLMVGLAGFEPATSCSRSRRATQAAPQPDGDGSGNRSRTGL